MKGTIAVLLAAVLAAFAQISLAQPAAVVEGVQMPAWLERASERRPLSVGMELKAGDMVRTGAGSRALVKLSEGSLVKLGENASLAINEINANSGGIFKAPRHGAAASGR